MEVTNKNIEDCLNQFVETNSDLFVVKMDLSGDRITVLMDGDNGISIGKCNEIGKLLRREFEENIEEFFIEISSPGISHPIENIRSFKKNLNRKLKVKSLGKEKKGILTSVNDSEIVIEHKERVPKEIGKGKRTVVIKDIIALSDIEKAVVVLDF